MRSSCEAVLTNVRRDCSCAARRRCMVGERAREIADLVAVPVVDRRRVVRSVLGHLAARWCAARSARRTSRVASTMPATSASRERDEGGGHERAPDHALTPPRLSSERRRTSTKRAPPTVNGTAACASTGPLPGLPACTARRPRATLAAPPGSDRRPSRSRPGQHVARRRRTRTPPRRSGAGGVREARGAAATLRAASRGRRSLEGGSRRARRLARARSPRPARACGPAGRAAAAP